MAAFRSVTAGEVRKDGEQSCVGEVPEGGFRNGDVWPELGAECGEVGLLPVDGGLSPEDYGEGADAVVGPWRRTISTERNQ